MTHNLELTTIELMITREALRELKKEHPVDETTRLGVITKIDEVAKADLGSEKDDFNRLLNVIEKSLKNLRKIHNEEKRGKE